MAFNAGGNKKECVDGVQLRGKFVLHVSVYFKWRAKRPDLDWHQEPSQPGCPERTGSNNDPAVFP